MDGQVIPLLTHVVYHKQALEHQLVFNAIQWTLVDVAYGPLNPVVISPHRMMIISTRIAFS